MNVNIARGIVAILATMAVAGCGKAPVDPEFRYPDMAENSPAQRSAARLLSIGNAVPLEFSSDAYTAAQFCVLGMEVVSGPSGENLPLSAAQRDAVQDARDTYAERAERLGSDRGKSAREVEADRLQLAERYPDQQERARIAINCMRQLAG